MPTLRNAAFSWYPDCSPVDNCHPENCHPDNGHLGQLPPSTIATQDKCYPDNCHLEQLPPKTNATRKIDRYVNRHLGRL